MLNVCGIGHEDIAHTERKCPLCELMERVDALEEEVSDKESKISELEGIVIELESQQKV